MAYRFLTYLPHNLQLISIKYSLIYLVFSFSEWLYIHGYGLGDRTMFMKVLHKLKDLIVWSWTYLWAIWFLLVSQAILLEIYFYKKGAPNVESR